MQKFEPGADSPSECTGSSITQSGQNKTNAMMGTDAKRQTDQEEGRKRAEEEAKAQWIEDMIWIHRCAEEKICGHPLGRMPGNLDPYTGDANWDARLEHRDVLEQEAAFSEAEELMRERSGEADGVVEEVVWGRRL